MIRVGLAPTALLRTVFAFSPMAELTSSLRLLTSGRVPAWHQPWYDEIRGGLGKLDWELLSVVAPCRHVLPDFMFQPSAGIGTSIESQLRSLAELSPDEIKSGLRETWSGARPPSDVRSLLASRTAVVARLTSALWDYWCVAFSPYWADIQATLHGDLMRREALLTEVGWEGVLATLHADLRFADDSLCIDKPDDVDWKLRSGATLVPSVFVPPHLAVPKDPERDETCVIYGAYRFDRTWTRAADHDRSSLEALIGSTRANILAALEVPSTTLALAQRLELKPPGVNEHLSAMKEAGLLRSRRHGKRVLYVRTSLANRLLEAAG